MNPDDFKGMFGYKFGCSLSSYKTVKVAGFGEIPRILVLITEWLERLDGFVEEGIFRLQPSHSQFENTKKQVIPRVLFFLNQTYL